MCVSELIWSLICIQIFETPVQEPEHLQNRFNFKSINAHHNLNIEGKTFGETERFILGST